MYCSRSQLEVLAFFTFADDECTEIVLLSIDRFDLDVASSILSQIDRSDRDVALTILFKLFEEELRAEMSTREFSSSSVMLIFASLFDFPLPLNQELKAAHNHHPSIQSVFNPNVRENKIST